MNELRFDQSGLIPAVVQDSGTGMVLMLGYMNSEALEATRREGLLYLWSRSRNALWLKGETSGNFQAVEEVRVNCEENSLLVLVHPQGPVCHDGYATCFYRRLGEDGAQEIIYEQLFDPAQVYIGDKGGEVATSQALQEATLRLWQGYEYLRDNDLTAVSTTSRLLRSPDLAYLGSRLSDELLELAGVLSGEHRHSGLEEDLVLEGSQVCYWTYLCALALKFTYDGLNPAQRLSTPGTLDKSELPEAIRAVARDVRSVAASAEKAEQVRLLGSALEAVGAALATREVDVLQLVRSDLRQMSARPYMRGYFGGDAPVVRPGE